VPAPVAPFAVQSGEGAALETPTGDVVTVKAATRQTNGSLTVLEFVIGPKKGPALHTHLREDELWYVIDGDFRFKAGGAMLRCRPAAWRSGRAGRRTPSRTSVRPRGGCW
jgi:quercetin dioxygenase-like cupin family protein